MVSVVDPGGFLEIGQTDSRHCKTSEQSLKYCFAYLNATSV